MFSFQIFEGQIAIIFKKFNYSNVLNRSEQKKKIVYNQFLTRLEGAVRREMKSLIIFIDFLQRDKKTFRNVNVLVLIRDFFFHVYNAYQTHRIIDDKKRIFLNTIENNWGADARIDYANKPHDYFSYVARVAKVRFQPMIFNQVQRIIDHRLTHSGSDVPTSKKVKNRDWKILTDQMLEKIIIGNRRFQNVISFYAASAQVLFSSERKKFPKSLLTRRFLRLRFFRRPFFSVIFFFLSFPPFHSFIESPSPRSQHNILQKSVLRMKTAPRSGAEPLASSDDRMEVEEEEEKVKMKKKKGRAQKKRKSRIKKAKRKKKKEKIMKVRFLKRCFCSAYSNGFGKDWKKNLNAVYGNGEMHQTMLCFSEMMYAEWKVIVCGKHCAMMKKALNMIFCEFAEDSRESLKKLWKIRYDFETYRQRNLSFFKNI